MQRGARDAATPQATDIEPSKGRDLALGKTDALLHRRACRKDHAPRPRSKASCISGGIFGSMARSAADVEAAHDDRHAELPKFAAEIERSRKLV